MTGLEGLLRGRVLGGRYRIEEVIGRGGMGAVYRSLDERLGRRVALKVITVAMGDDPDTRRRVRARFHREARAAAALPHHPNVVPVYDYGTDDELGLDYIVMELLEGHDLATHLQRSGAPPLPTALRVLREAARGLAVGHRAGLIHRDVKPGNIFLARDHDELQVRMVDFGIAKLADDEDTANQLTQDGRLPHSPAYASPEQLRGLSQLTAASDVFSLGAVGYQLLSGERPFTDSDRNRMSLGLPVPPPSPRSRNQAIPASVDEIIQRALAFDAVDRFPDAIAMAAALDRVLRDMPDSPVEPFTPLAAAGLPIVAGSGAAAVDDDERTHLMDVSAVDEDERTQLMDLPATAAAGAAGATAGAGAPPPRPGDPAAGAARTPQIVQPRKSRTPLLVWSFVLLALAAVGVWAVMENGGRTQVAMEVPDDSLAFDTAAPPADTAPPAPTAEEINRRGIEVFREGRVDEALGLFQEALDLAPDNAEIRQNVGIALERLNRVDDARDFLADAIQRNPALTNAYGALSQVHLARNDTTAAIAALEQYVRRAPPGREKARAENQLQQLRNERLLLGVPVDTAAPPNPAPSATAQPAPTPP
ncbi:MAG: protein kinase [Gemmatimonadetes bacterium]|nr:protein kinase [Gemmatimonadota bacterium]